MDRKRWGHNTRENDPRSGRDKILRAARSCYQHKGIAGTTLDDVAREAGITRRTVYRYFPNKQAIIQAVVDEQAQSFLSRVREEVEDASLDFPSQLQRYIVYLVEFGRQAPGYQLLLGNRNAAQSSSYYLGSEDNYRLLKSLVRDSFLEARASGVIRAELDLDALLAWVGRIVFSYIQVPTDPQTLESQVAEFVIPALLPQEARGC